MKIKCSEGAKFYFIFFGALILVVFLVLSQGTHRVVTTVNGRNFFENVPTMETPEFMNAVIAVLSLYALGGFFVIVDEEPNGKKRKYR